MCEVCKTNPSSCPLCYKILEQLIVINLTRYFFGSLFVDLGVSFMTDCFQLLGQLSDLSCGLIWLSGSKIIISYFTAIPHRGWQRWPFENHTCETKATSRLGEDLPEILQADSTCMREAITVFFFFYYSQLTQWIHILLSTCPKYPSPGITSICTLLLPLSYSCILWLHLSSPLLKYLFSFLMDHPQTPVWPPWLTLVSFWFQEPHQPLSQNLNGERPVTSQSSSPKTCKIEFL